MIRCVIAGSRTVKDYDLVERLIHSVPWHPSIAEVGNGTAKGVDSHGESWALKHGIKVRDFAPKVADWDTFWEAAYARNQEMADWCDRGIVVWDGTSPGTQDMMRRLIRCKRLFRVFNLAQSYWADIEGNEVGEAGMIQ